MLSLKHIGRYMIITINIDGKRSSCGLVKILWVYKDSVKVRLHGIETHQPSEFSHATVYSSLREDDHWGESDKIYCIHNKDILAYQLCDRDDAPILVNWHRLDDFAKHYFFGTKKPKSTWFKYQRGTLFICGIILYIGTLVFIIIAK